MFDSAIRQVFALRDERLAGVGPLERFGGEVVVLDEGQHLGGEISLGVKNAVTNQPALKDRGEDVDLVEPRGVLWE